MKILITGANGFIGKNLCSYFTERGHVVIGDRFDITDDFEIRRTLSMYRPEVIINCASYGNYPEHDDQDHIYDVCFTGTRYLLEAAKDAGVAAFIQAGSSSEYGINCSGPREDQTTAPNSHYAAAKAAATSLVQFYGATLKLPAWSLRLYSVYGPHERESRMIPTLLREGAQGKLPPIVNPVISRDFIHVDDVAASFDRVIQLRGSLLPGQVFNICTGVKTTMGILVSLTRELQQVKALPEYGSMNPRAWDCQNWFGNPNKAANVLKWKSEVPLKAGLERTLAWRSSQPML